MHQLRKLVSNMRRVVVKTTPRLFFVRGHPRSGTNWVGALLNLHPKIHCTGEYHFDQILDAVRGLQRQTWHLTGREPVRTVLDECMADMIRRCLAATAPENGAEVLGDRTPRELPDDGRGPAPDAPYILVVRDGRDVAVSWTFHLLRQPKAVIDTVVPSGLRATFQGAADEFQLDPKAFVADPARLFAHEGWLRFVARRWGAWVRHDANVVESLERSGETGRVLVVRYEALHADVESGRREMYTFLGLEPSEAAPLSRETRTEAGFGREDLSSFFRKGEVGDWERFATDSMKEWFRQEAGDALIALGYEKDRDW